MEYRKLGRTGIEVSVLGIGTWQLAGPLILEGKADGYPDPGKGKVVDLIRACGDLGINFIDSAEIYGAGEGERRVGLAIRDQRERWIVSTKFGLRRGAHGEKISDAGPATIRTSLENTLQRLQTDYVDIYLYHCSPDTPSIVEGKRVLEALKREGKLRFYGISTNRDKVLNRLIQQDSADVVMFSQSLVTHNSRILDLVRKHALGGIVRGALEAGQLSGKYFHAPPEFANEDFRKSRLREAEAQSYSVYEQLLPEGVSMPQFALRYLLDFDTTHTIVLGGKTIEQYREAHEACLKPPLGDETRAALQKIRENFTAKPSSRTFLDRFGRWFRKFKAKG